MSWKGLSAFESDLCDALQTFDWCKVDELCSDLRRRIASERDPIPVDAAVRVLKALRRKRRFTAMNVVAEALFAARSEDPWITIFHAQALIDSGSLSAAEALLRPVAERAPKKSPLESEARGLLARVEKQRFLASTNPKQSAARVALCAAIAAYRDDYEGDPAKNQWHGINAVALAARGERDRVALDRSFDHRAVARAILERSLNQERRECWDYANALEARLALGAEAAKDVKNAAMDYANSASGADAFEFGSTLRQLTEVWELTDTTSPGKVVLPILRAALLRCSGGRIDLTSTGVQSEHRAALQLEKNFGSERLKTLRWYTMGLERCEAIGRVERKQDERAWGTGWLVDASQLLRGGKKGEVLFVTNAHVVSTQESGALHPDDARVRFMISKRTCEIDRVMWSSPIKGHDATICKLKNPPRAAPLPISKKAIAVPKRGGRAPRLYVIGHPGGRELEFSLQDNVMLGSDDKYVHYRTPTEPGSSGSPVFDEDGWEVVALHHAGSEDKRRLDGSGVYDANEGIRISAIREAEWKSRRST